jgi:hypothetical protein
LVLESLKSCPETTEGQEVCVLMEVLLRVLARDRQRLQGIVCSQPSFYAGHDLPCSLVTCRLAYIFILAYIYAKT